MRQYLMIGGLASVGWMGMAILCTYILGNVDIRLGDRPHNPVAGWMLIGKSLLAVCLFHVVVHTGWTIQGIVAETQRRLLRRAREQ